jgi:hypothetical protein
MERADFLSGDLLPDYRSLAWLHQASAGFCFGNFSRGFLRCVKALSARGFVNQTATRPRFIPARRRHSSTRRKSETGADFKIAIW